MAKILRKCKENHKAMFLNLSAAVGQKSLLRNITLKKAKVATKSEHKR